MGLADIDRDLGAAGGGGLSAIDADLGTQPAAPSTATRLYQDYVGKPLTKVAALAGQYTPIDAGQAALSKVTGGMVPMPTPTSSDAIAQRGAELVVPQTPLQAGAMVGTMGAGSIAAKAGLRPGMAALSRITGGAIGGEAGNVAEGGQAGKGAAIGGGGALVGEGVSAAGGKLLRSLPNNPFVGGKRNIAAQDAGAYGAEMGRQSPPLAGAKTVEDLQGLAQGEGRQRIGDAKEQIVRQIEALTGNAPLSVPSLDANRNFTLREANDELSRIGVRMKNPLTRTFQDRDQSQLYGQVGRELDAALGAAHPDAPGLFQQAQGDYAKGLSLLAPLQQQNAYRLSPTDIQFNTPAIQRSLQNPKNAAAMRNKLGDAGYEALLNTMTRGAGQGQDVLASGRGGVLDAAMQSIGRGTNSGAMGMLGVPLRTALPNVGSQYAGRQPYSLPPALQQILDVVLQRQAGQVGQ